MCTILTLWWEDLDGKRIEEVQEITYESPDSFTAAQPTCTCQIGDDSQEGTRLRQHFVESALKPMLAKPFAGRIVIEVL